MSSNVNPSVKKSSKSKWIMGLILLILTGSLIFCVGYAYVTYNYIQEEKAEKQRIESMEQVVLTDYFYEGLHLDSVPLGGKSYSEAREFFRQQAENKLDELKIELKYEDRKWIIDAALLNAYIDWEEKLEKAYDVGRTGKLENRYNKVMELKEKGLHFVSMFTYDMEALSKKIEEITKEIYKAPKEANIEFNPETNKFNISKEEVGYSVDKDKLFETVVERIDKWNFEQVEIVANTLKPKRNADKLSNATQLISSFSTSLAGSSTGRRNNVELALKFCNGLKLEPGEVFSFNDVVGPSTAEAGFMKAPVIAADKSMVDALGGGICQSSTTLYNAALMADLEIVERYHHSFPVSYVPKGLDASIYYGSADLKFKNNKDTPIFIKTYSKGDRVYVEIYGEPLPNGQYIKLESEVTHVEPAPKPRYVEDTKGKYVKPGQQKLHAQSRPGYKVKSYKVYYNKDNKVVRREQIVYDYYVPIQGIIYYRN